MEAVNFDIIPKVHTIFFLFNCFEFSFRMTWKKIKKKKINNGKTEECLLAEKCFWTALQTLLWTISF